MSYLLKINLSSPAILSPYATLDGALGWCAVQEAKRAGTLRNFDECLSSLPLSKVDILDGYIYAVSSWFLEAGDPYKIGNSFITRRTPTGRVAEFVPNHKARISESVGINKNYRVARSYILTDSVNFLFDGDKERVAVQIEEWMTAIGKEANIGFGAVKSIDIRDDDRKPLLTDDGVVRRPIPVDAADTIGVRSGLDNVAMHFFMPPYSPIHPERQKPCIMPKRSHLLGR